MTIYDAYGEDGDFAYMNGGVGSSVTINTSSGSGWFRPGYARCGVGIASNETSFMSRVWTSGMISTGWHSGRVFCNPYGTLNTTIPMLAFIDSSLIQRIQIINTTANPSGPFNVYKINAAGTQTLLGTTTSGFSYSPTIADKFDIYFNYSSSGSLIMYINGNIVFNCTGDITTDSNTGLAGTNYGGHNGTGGVAAYSELIVASQDTRNFSLVTSAATGAGTLDQWTGAYTNVNEIQVNDGNFDTTTTSGNAQRYLMSEITAGNFDIAAVVTNLRATQGGGSLSHIALTQRIGGTAYTTTAKSFPTAFGQVQYIQQTNPATGVAWVQSDINSGTFESGYIATT